MYTRAITSIFCLLLLSTLIKIDILIIGKSQLSNLKNSVQSPILLARAVHDADDRSPPREEKA